MYVYIVASACDGGVFSEIEGVFEDWDKAEDERIRIELDLGGEYTVTATKWKVE